MTPISESTARRFALLPFFAWATLYRIVWRVQALFISRDQAFSHVSQALARIPGLRGKLLRLAFYRLALRSCGPRVSFGFGTILSDPDAEIGDHVYIGAYCSLGLVRLADDVLLGNNVDIPSGKARHHFDRLDVPIRLQGGTRTRVCVGRDAWVGNSATVLADVGDRAVVGAGSVVTQPVPDETVSVGVPARVVRRRGAPAESRSTGPA